MKDEHKELIRDLLEYVEEYNQKLKREYMGHKELSGIAELERLIAKAKEMIK